MADALRVYFAFRSPYSRLGLHKVFKAKLADRVPLQVVAFTRPANNEPMAMPDTTPTKRAYLTEDVARMTARAGLPLAQPEMDVDWKPSLLAYFAAAAAGRGLEFALAVSNARWGEGKDISETDVLAYCAAEAGLTADDIAPPTDFRERLAADQALIDQDGVFGIPFAALEIDGAKERFFGQDRFDLLLERFGVQAE